MSATEEKRKLQVGTNLTKPAFATKALPFVIAVHPPVRVRLQVFYTINICTRLSVSPHNEVPLRLYPRPRRRALFTRIRSAVYR